MKLDNYIRRSLSRQFLSILGVFTVLFLVGAIVIFLAMQNTNETYYDDRAKIIEKEKVVKEINDNFNGAFFNARGYFAFNNQELKLKALAEQSTIDNLINELETKATTGKDRAFIKEIREFSDSYFNFILPEIIGYYEDGQKDKVAEVANSGVTANINSFQDKMKTYLGTFDVELNQRVDELMSYQSNIQLGFVGFFLIVILILIAVITYMITNIGQPLAQFAKAANEITQGKDTLITLDAKRTDELGALFVAFRKMMVSVQEKEMDLMSHNEELIAQQDELHAQQNELEKTLYILSRNESKLTRRNSLINGISNSLQKCEVLHSIVVNMSEVIEADKGMIVMIQENLYSSYGITEKAVEQFRENLNNGLHERLLLTKRSFTIKREASVDEKGFHLDTLYCYDLFLPVLSANKTIIAVMLYSRYGEPFSEEELTEYNILSKQIGISLDKIKLYEKSEEDRKLAQDILNTMQEGMLLVDSNGTIIQINNQLQKQFDHTGGDHVMIGQESNDWIPFMSRNIVEKDQFAKYMRHVCAEISVDEENSLTFKNDQTDRVEVLKVYGKALFRGQVRFGTVFVFRDITKEFEVDQMKSEFVSTVSHELRTPLASILGFTELMLNRELKIDRQRKYLNTIYQEAKRLTSLINEFLDIQRMESGKQLYEKKFIELEQVIEKTIDSQQIMTDRHIITLESPKEGSYVLGDKEKIEQVFTNLINNAIKYSPEGGTIKLKVSKNQNYVCVDITDEGLGIPADSINDLFNKFFRVDNSDRRTIGGTGLGLSIVKEIMKSHNGDVHVKSRYGEGSTFTVFFPIVEGHGEHFVHHHELPASEHYWVMLVEDDFSLGELISQELIESGFRVQLYTNGEDALRSLENNLPDAIILDIMLESADDLDGWSIMQFLKQDARFENIPIIISSALDEMEKGYSLGATNYLIKPYKTSQLSKAIMQTLLKMGKVGQILVPQKQVD